MRLIRPDRRQFERYSPTGQATAVFKSYDGQVKVGPITNIGRDGLLFEYHDIHNMGINIEGEIDVFTVDHDFLISTIPCKITHNTEVIQEQCSSVPIPIMRCGVKFGELTQKNIDLLDSFLSELKSSSSSI